MVLGCLGFKPHKQKLSYVDFSVSLAEENLMCPTVHYNNIRLVHLLISRKLNKPSRKKSQDRSGKIKPE
jgi:hypothetical protein